LRGFALTLSLFAVSSLGQAGLRVPKAVITHSNSRFQPGSTR
jgi:hypothetical protein